VHHEDEDESLNKLPSGDLQFITAATADLWEQLRGQRVFITGGTGFFGCWLLESFCAANRAFSLNARATVLTRNPEAFRKKAPHLAGDSAVELIAGDVRTFDFPPGEFPFIVHAATQSNSAEFHGTDLEMFDTIVDGTRRTLQFARHRGAKKFLLLSSGAVYGEQPAEIAHIEESYRGAPKLTGPASAYAEGKRAAEALCLHHSRESGVECKIARCFAFVGPHLPLDAHFAIGNFIANALRGEPIQIKGDGTPLRSYLYMADTMVWLWTILFRGPSLRALNVGSENAVSIAALARTVADALAPGLEVTIARRPAPGSVAPRYVPSTHAARHELGLTETVTLREAILRTAEWYKPVIGR
jgi:dTDP-glucose 4,6-dehydratase